MSSEGAQEAYEGIRAVLAGTRPFFKQEYACHSPTGQRWFLLQATPLPGDEGGAVVSHVDITERKLAEEERALLLAREERARAEAEDTARQLRRLQSVTDAALRHLTLADLMPALLDRIRQVMAVDDACILLAKEDGQELTARITCGQRQSEELHIPLEKGVVGRIAASRQPLIVDDLAAEEGMCPDLRERLRSLAAVPLLVEGRLLGVLHVGSATPRHFTAQDVELLQQVADRIALALEHAQLYEGAQAAQQEATQRAQQLDAVFAAIVDGVFVFDADGRLVQANAVDRELLGEPPLHEALEERVRRADLQDADGAPLLPEQAPSVRVLHGEVLSSDRAVDVRARAADGRQVEFSVTGAPMRDAQGHILGGVMVYRDVTERRRLERRTAAALDALLEMARALVGPDTNLRGEAAPAEVDVVARRLAELTRSVFGCKRVSIARLNPETEQVRPVAQVGWTAERQWYADVARFRVADLMPATLITRLRAGEVIVTDLTEAIQRGAPAHGVRQALIAPLQVGTHLLGVLGLDYDDRPHAYTPQELALAQAVGQLAALVLERERLLREREEARGRELAARQVQQHMDQFFAMAAHDIRSPVSAIQGYAQLALRRYERLEAAVAAAGAGAASLDAPLVAVRDSLFVLDQSGERLAQLVARLFDVAQARSGTMQVLLAPCDLVALVRELVEAQRVATPRRTIHLGLPEVGAVSVVADADRLSQVLANYLTNALKYSADDSPVEVRLEVLGQQARVSVRDQGPGLPPEEQERVWEMYHRAPGIEVQSAAGGSLGLGLHICKRIIELHGGRVGVESEVGRGSAFWLMLPLTAETGASTPVRR